MPQVTVTNSRKAATITSDSFKLGFWYVLDAEADFNSNRDLSYLYATPEDNRDRAYTSGAILRLDPDNGIITIVDYEEDLKFSPEPVSVQIEGK